MFGSKKHDGAKGVKPGVARALVVSLTEIDPSKYNGWDGKNGCAGCGIDAARMAEMLRYGGYEVDLLQDRQATTGNVLEKLRQAAKLGGTFFFFYAGHGGQMPDTDGDEATEMGGAMARTKPWSVSMAIW